MVDVRFSARKSLNFKVYYADNKRDLHATRRIRPRKLAVKFIFCQDYNVIYLLFVWLLPVLKASREVFVRVNLYPPLDLPPNFTSEVGSILMLT